MSVIVCINLVLWQAGNGLAMFCTSLYSISPNVAKFRVSLNSLKMVVRFTVHECTVSQSVTYTQHKPFSGQCNLSFIAISLNLDACFGWFTSVLNCKQKGPSGQYGA